MAILALRGALYGNAPDWLDARWLYALQAAVPLLFLLAFRSDYRELAEAPRSPAALLLALATGIGVFILWIVPMPAWMSTGETVAPFRPVGPDQTPLWGLIAVRAFGAVLVVPVMEELFWRSFLMRWIDRRDFLHWPPAQVSWTGIFASSAVFALAHSLWLAGLAAGLAYAWVYRRTGNLWYPVLAHATTNGALAAWVVATGDWSYW
jgi:CAAX prenyl protease-like protein